MLFTRSRFCHLPKNKQPWEMKYDSNIPRQCQDHGANALIAAYFAIYWSQGGIFEQNLTLTFISLPLVP